MTTPTESAAASRAIAAKPRLRPDEAALYLETQHGLTYAVGTLMKLRSKGGGPEFRKFGQRVCYDLEALDSWAAEKLGRAQRSTSDIGAVMS